MHLLSIGVFPLRVGVLGIEVVFALGWDERRTGLLMVELVPVVVLEPLVVLQILGAIQAETVGRFPLD